MTEHDLWHSLVDTVSGTLSAHGTALPAVARSYAPGDFSIHLFLQLAVILIAEGGACYLAARLSGEDNRTALGIGALMNSRGLIELIIINIGLQKGIIFVLDARADCDRHDDHGKPAVRAVLRPQGARDGRTRHARSPGARDFLKSVTRRE